MTTRESIIVFTKLKDEPFFSRCGENLKQPDGTQAATITSIDTIRLERQVDSDLDKWEVAVEASGFTSLQVLDDPKSTLTDDMIAGVVTADKDADPAPGDYRIIAECTITLVAALGGSPVGKVFRQPARIVATSVTAPVS